MEIVGDGRNSTVIDAAGTSNIFRQSGSPSSLAIRHLTLRNSLGSALDWGGSIGSGLATIDDVLFYNNSTTFKGGAINNEWELSVTDCSFQSNRATGGTNNYGGAIFSAGTATITNSEFISNLADISAPTGGGGGAISGGGLTIVDSSFVSNQAKIGGALSISGTNRILNSTFSNNSAQTFNSGAIFATNSGTSISNSTVSQNTNGGVAVQTGGELFIQSSTFYDNTGAANINGTITIKNSMLLSFSGGTNCSGVITSDGYNLDNNNTCTMGGTGDLSGVDPLLGQLLDNGGPTKTHALNYGSPAIDGGNPAGCTDDVGGPILTDQRGNSRSIDGNVDGTPRCDIGAYEAEPAMIYLPLIMR
jgi:predicted outer membrane repeat protein